MKYYGYYQSPIGWIELVANQEALVSLSFFEKADDIQLLTSDNLIINNCIQQLKKYFNQELQRFDLPLIMKGTQFQKLVWKETFKIAYGETITYQELAKRINKAKAVRAVGSALGKNPLAIIIPCHRVVRTNNNKVINYYWGKERKVFLQKLEK